MKLPIKETIMTGVCVAILCGLGTWQIKRMHWKNDIIQRLETQYENGRKAAPLTTAQLDEISDDKNPMAYGRVSGHLLRDQSILLGPKSEEGRIGYHLLIPLQVEQGHTLIVNAGWVSALWKDNGEDRLAVLPQDVTVRGIMRVPDWSSFASKNSPDNDFWYRADIAQIAKAKNLKNPYPFLLYADQVDPELADVKPIEEHWLPRNKHLQYALFWYALAMIMLGIFGIYTHGQNKKIPA
ncbi:MAG: hypothetical protein DI551_01850 [Micavibrio aeruginosavorus]|uniref:SURF1-like protein n=1 Tax=Micavibrio aeruginosavorus TaxID=349221 RepID=A0A2W5NBZ4_9BACT|nr:MAG: hypothetical protein DI551_01850 [Micavibrio aeruginosavorus]